MSSVLQWPRKRSSIEQQLKEVIAVVDRLRDSTEHMLPADHPCHQDIDDFWWRTKRFAETVGKKLK